MAYSKDLRTRVVDAYFAKEGSIVTVAQRFRVGISTVVKWINRQRQGLGLEPRHGGGKPRLIRAELEPEVERILEKHPDATLDVLKKLIQEQLGMVVSRTTICRTNARMGITIKKNGSRLRKRQTRRAESPTKL